MSADETLPDSTPGDGKQVSSQMDRGSESETDDRVGSATVLSEQIIPQAWVDGHRLSTSDGAGAQASDGAASSPAKADPTTPSSQSNPRVSAPKRFKAAHEVMTSKALDLLRGRVKGAKQCARDLLARGFERLLRRLLASDCLRFSMAES
eukprot:CAMPEP_0113698672 /NCGR_PEP_ID=MMETSP0038_2-20120614/22846_1 /TAXON_ID=2898 /ORGANISM="Cryptomonas paramecium" /LENGTH=149 /DNA_ID=CAMNT_0000621873 /DNA_START=186 /DNA_END=631 /DNA_ORIENTATION=+ /assembly_acc=CAM_ASM_000170